MELASCETCTVVLSPGMIKVLKSTRWIVKKLLPYILSYAEIVVNLPSNAITVSQGIYSFELDSEFHLVSNHLLLYSQCVYGLDHTSTICISCVKQLPMDP